MNRGCVTILAIRRLGHACCMAPLHNTALIAADQSITYADGQSAAPEDSHA